MRRHARGLLIALLVGACSWTVVPAASAQSPGPNVTFTDETPGSNIYTYRGVIIEGLGDGVNGSCSYSTSQINTATVNALAQSKATITELSPQSGCNTITGYENVAYNIEHYIEAYGVNVSTRWGGIMLDEEDGFGFSPAQLETLNQYVHDLMLGTPGVSWYYTQNFSGTNVWSQTDYNTIAGTSHLAPQVSTAYMKTLVNNYGGANMVTWATTYPYPYNSESASVNAISGPAYQENFGSTSTLYWDDHFVPA